MSQLEDVTKELSEMCFGTREPLRRLINHGRLPDGWADRFLELAAIARPMLSADAQVPAKLLVCFHFASIYPWLRYIVWSRGKTENDDTRRELGRISGTSELLLMKLANEELAVAGAELAEEGPLRGDDATLVRRVLDSDS